MYIWYQEYHLFMSSGGLGMRGGRRAIHLSYPADDSAWGRTRSLKVTLRRSSHTVAVVLRTAAHPLRRRGRVRRPAC
jgi:hypothetical protein